MGLLADHQTVWEASRLVPALLLAVGLVLAGALVAVVVRQLSTARSARALAYVGVGLVVGSVAVGLIPREAASGYVVCGPVLNVTGSDSELCGTAMGVLPEIVVAGMSAAAISFATAVAVARRRRDTHMPPNAHALST